jgi:hypothetical protein
MQKGVRRRRGLTNRPPGNQIFIKVSKLAELRVRLKSILLTPINFALHLAS